MDNYEAKIVWVDNNGKEVKKLFIRWLLGLFTNTFIRLYNEAVEKVNPNLETWNKEFNEKYPNKDGYSSEYNKFIGKKIRKLIRGLGGLLRITYEDIDGSGFDQFVGVVDYDEKKSYKCYTRLEK